MNMDRKFVRDLEAMNACEPALEYCRGFRSFRAAWAACQNPEWMLWRLGRGPGALGRLPAIVELARGWAADAAADAADAVTKKKQCGDIRAAFPDFNGRD